jgi:NTP pyrophosphatase (non-canonical NTP hydrolase)
MHIETMTDDVLRTFTAYEKTGTNKRDYKIAANDLSYQVGSLTKRIMQLNNERYREDMNDDRIKTLIADELVDIVAEVLFISHELGINMATARSAMLWSDEAKIKERTS